MATSAKKSDEKARKASATRTSSKKATEATDIKQEIGSFLPWKSPREVLRRILSIMFSRERIPL
jgi:hypothetical protein